jgi:hypothetical protein
LDKYEEGTCAVYADRRFIFIARNYKNEDGKIPYGYNCSNAEDLICFLFKTNKDFKKILLPNGKVEDLTLQYRIKEMDKAIRLVQE